MSKRYLNLLYYVCIRKALNMTVTGGRAGSTGGGDGYSGGGSMDNTDWYGGDGGSNGGDGKSVVYAGGKGNGADIALCNAGFTLPNFSPGNGGTSGGGQQGGGGGGVLVNLNGKSAEGRAEGYGAGSSGSRGAKGGNGVVVLDIVFQ